MIGWNAVPRYIEAIEEYIREDTRKNGRMVGIPPGRERVGDRADLLAKRLVDLSNILALELGFGGDQNITFLQCLSMISYSWMIFILQAKSNAEQRYPIESLAFMKKLVGEYPAVFQKIHDEAVKLGNEYEVDNPKWIAAVAEWESKQI